jgi:hypothetical protein
MRPIRTHFRFIAGVVSIVLVSTIVFGKTESSINEAEKFLPDSIDSFKASGPPLPFIYTPQPADMPAATATRKYTDDLGRSFTVDLMNADSESAAYALLTELANTRLPIDTGKIGTASVDEQNRVVFYRGSVVAQLSWKDGAAGSNESLRKAAQALAATLPTSEDDVPALVKHLPPGAMSAHPSYRVSLTGLKSCVSSQPILDVLDFSGGTEAVVADYGRSQLVIVEFTTPQMSIDNDSRVWTKLAELKSQGQPTPNAYRRVGNYSVFVFNAPDDKTANALVEQVKYEQVVQWLGDDPHLADRLQRYFTQTSAGVLIAVLKSSGLSLILCLAVGGVIGALLFRHRRAQRAAAFSDAGGSIRLNLDELTGAPENTRRLLSTSEESRNNPAS